MKKIFILLSTFYFLLSGVPTLAADVLGRFPTLLEHNGAHAKSGDVWLGVLRDSEGNRKDDDNDDGVVADLAAGKATFLVHVAKPGKTIGTAYLNLWADWNLDGQWSGGDEWALQNHPIDLSKQISDLQPYVVSFPAGKNTDVWYRATVSLDEKIISENGGGEFGVGEVEDYGPAQLILSDKDANGRPRVPSKTRGLLCYPSPLLIDHGQSIEFNVGVLPGWDKPASTGFGSNNPGLNAGGTGINLPTGKITKQPRNPNSFGDPGNPFVFTSTKVHDIGALEKIPVTIEATYADGKTADVVCTVLVWHPPHEPEQPIPIEKVSLDLTSVPPNPLVEIWGKIKDLIKKGGEIIKDAGGKIIDGLPPLKNIFAPQLPAQLPVETSVKENLAHTAVCSPDPLIMDHGQSGVITVSATGKSAPIQNVTYSGSTALAGYGNVKPQTELADNQRFIYTSTKVHDADYTESVVVTFDVKFADGVANQVDCLVKINHPLGLINWIKKVTQSASNAVKGIVNPVTEYSAIPLPTPNTQTPNIKIPPLVQAIAHYFNELLPDLVVGQISKVSEIVIDAFETEGEVLRDSPTPYPTYSVGARNIRNLLLGIPVSRERTAGEGDIIPLQRQIFNIVLPAPERRTISLPTFEGLIRPSSPFDFFSLSAYLRQLSESLQKLAVAPITQTNPICYVRIASDANQQNIYTADAACVNYVSCSLRTRNLTGSGSVVSVEVNNTFSGAQSFTRSIPTGAAIATWDLSCIGHSPSEDQAYSAIAHSFKVGSDPTTTKASGPGPTITTGSLPAGTTNTAYSQTVYAIGGTLPYTWAVYSGSLPTGLSLNTTTGVISGTPSSAATYNFALQATGGDGVKSSDKSFSIVINSGSTPLTITTTSPIATCHITCQNPNPPAVPNAAATGGTTPYTWTLSGLDACATTNSLTITTGGVWGANVVSNCTGNGTLTVTDAALNTATLNFAQQELTF